MPTSPPKTTIRPALKQDIPSLSNLCTQLGYPASGDEIQSRLEEAILDGRNAVYVAEVDGSVAGWVQVHAYSLLVSGKIAQVGGLVVDEGFRKLGIGKLLMQEAENWARRQGCGRVYLQSNIIRKDAHPFYEKVGYENRKTQYQFRKILGKRRD